MAIDRGNTEDKQEIGMSQLIDCVFLLLIFFLVSTMNKKKKMDIDIDLPESAAEEKVLPKGPDEMLVLGITSTGDFFLNGEPVTYNALRDQLAISSTTMQVRLDADSKTPLSVIVKLIDLCQFYQFSNIGIRTYDEFYNR